MNTAENMEIWKNKKSGKGFIYVEDTGEDEALFVITEGGIVSRKQRHSCHGFADTKIQGIQGKKKTGYLHLH